MTEVIGALAYPVRFDVQYPSGERRFMILVRWLLVIPHLIVLAFVEFLYTLVGLLTAFVILFTGRMPDRAYRVLCGYLRWDYNATAYILFHNRYPPFNWNEDEYGLVAFEVDRQEQYNRWLPFVKWLLAVPHHLILLALSIAGLFVYLYVLAAVLVTGVYPRGAFEFLVGVGRWTARVNAYVGLLTDRYPPFSLR